MATNVHGAALLASAMLGSVAVLGTQALITSRTANARLVRPEFDQRVQVGSGDHPVRIALLGDSTVAGIGVRSLDAWLGTQIAERVHAGTGRPVEVVGFGVSGARTAQVVDAQVPRLDAYGGSWDAVVAVVGGNDATHLTPWWQLSRDTRRLVQNASDAAGGAPVIHAGSPRFIDAVGVPRPLRDLFDWSSRRVAGVQHAAVADAQRGATYVDIGTESSLRYRGRLDSISADGFHPSAIGYGFWADAIAPRVIERVAPAQRLEHPDELLPAP